MPLKFFAGILLSLTVSLAIINCTSSRQEGAESPVTTAKIEVFEKFYDQFINDSTFQRSRLKFPLGGNDERGHKWTPTNWHLMQTKIFDVDSSKFRVYTHKSDSDFFQKVWIPNSGFSSEARFKRIDGKWYLVADFELNN